MRTILVLKDFFFNFCHLFLALFLMAARYCQYSPSLSIYFISRNPTITALFDAKVDFILYLIIWGLLSFALAPLKRIIEKFSNLTSIPFFLIFFSSLVRYLSTWCEHFLVSRDTSEELGISDDPTEYLLKAYFEV